MVKVNWVTYINQLKKNYLLLQPNLPCNPLGKICMDIFDLTSKWTEVSYDC